MYSIQNPEWNIFSPNYKIKIEIEIGFGIYVKKIKNRLIISGKFNDIR